MTKKGISPLVSTLILIILAIVIGIIVMNWGRAQLEAGAKCSIETNLKIVELNNAPQICYSATEKGFIKFIVENGANINIDSLQLRTIGTKDIYTTEVPQSKIEKGYTLQKIIPYSTEVFGKIKQIRLTPKIIVFAGEPSVLCPEQAQIVENIKEC